jgi:25S rRNA (cytosine2870-C5)-methyltransferase
VHWSWSHIQRSFYQVEQSRLKLTQTLLDVKKAAHLQRELLRAAVDCCKVGGTIVYSTCSIAAEENEGVVNYILGSRYVKIVETGLPIEKEGLVSYEDKRYDPRLKLSRRVYPHMHNMDGFFIAKLIKFQDGKRAEISEGGAEKKAVVKKVSTKGMGKRDRMKLKGKKKVHPKKEEEPVQEPEKENEEMLQKRKSALKAKLAMIKKKKLA